MSASIATVPFDDAANSSALRMFSRPALAHMAKMLHIVPPSERPTQDTSWHVSNAGLMTLEYPSSCVTPR
eukprot:CAMPEP_0172558760 /NCGR_PEP_ID=MMETSP1067-20121228/80792_1 /TAXON_ID=265564 ORGANISM="Thalassiosira punctigera, Strain Tpunct2005C2" /NCGR_SAMPLE_ID=MMETSP1067 /ASSEMBLY_ACC=CAM_ASM_000444 /LENGTH=69 /DNA_ID=CAMNT_0013348193 /DNA_START=95 /DNA_END=301 /DNA_ORIENTATION=+